MKRPKTFQDKHLSLGLSTLMLAYSNGLALYARHRGKNVERLFRRVNRPLLALMLFYAANRPGGLREVGIKREGLWKAASAGLGVGAALSVPPLLFFFKPFLLDTPLEYGPINRMTRRELWMEVLFDVPVGIAVLEELAHRGLLYSALDRSYGTKAAVIGSAVVFAGWHLTVTAASTADTNLSAAFRLPPPLRPYTQPLAVAGGMLSTGAAGLLFGWLRATTGNLAAPVIAHWLVDGVMISALWLHGRRVSRETSHP